MTIYGYIRVSTEDQIDNTSLETQKSMIEGVAKANQLPDNKIVWLEDGGISGVKPFMERPAVAPKVFRNGDVIIVSALDRFSRDMRDCLNAVHELKERRVKLIINGHGDVTDDSNLYSRLMFEILGAFAGHERRTIRMRMANGKKAKSKKGGYIGGKVPWGMEVVGEGQDANLVPLFSRREEAIWRMKNIRNRENKYGRKTSYRAVAEEITKIYNWPINHNTVKAIVERS
tara:strand:+ start:367 stop:1056 length:690 start_codon:yes stop_codon:yes gene_type:complete